MTPRTIEPAQQAAAKIAGFLYLVTLAIQLLAEMFFRAPLLVRGDAVQTAKNIVASEGLFRISIAASLMIAAGHVVLLVALYVALKPVNRHLALLAAFWRLAECAIFAVTTLNDFLALRLLSGTAYLQPFDTAQLQALARMLLTLRHEGGQIAGVFLGLGSTVFAYLWWKSRYIPRALAAWGIFASLVLTVVLLTDMVFPGSAAALSVAYWAPMFLFEVTLGFWLLIRGLRAPVAP